MRVKHLSKLFLSLTAFCCAPFLYADEVALDVELLKKRTLCLDIADVAELSQMSTELYDQIMAESGQEVSLGFINAYTSPVKNVFDFNGLPVTHIIFSGGGGVGVVFSGSHVQELVEQHQLEVNPNGFGGWRKYQRVVSHGQGMFDGWENYSAMYVEETQDGKHTALYCLMDTKQK